MSKRDSYQIPDERFSCQSCGRCCTMWTITLDQSRVDLLRKHDWGGDPFVRRRGEGDPYRIRMSGGRCFFLEQDGTCRIHNTLGYEAKPEGCKAFPLHVAQVAGKTHFRLSFYCPAVTGQEGKKLKEQMRWLKATTQTAGDVARKVPLQLDPTLELTLRDVEAIEGKLLELLSRLELPVADRLAAGSALLERLQRVTRESGKRALLPALKQVGTGSCEELALEGRQGGSAAKAGPVLSLFLGQDCRPGAFPRLGHFFGVRFYHMGLSRLRSQMMGAKASRRAIEAVAFDPPTAGNELLTRYFTHKLRARRTLCGELTMITGFNLLIAAYGMINTLARLRAASEGRTVCDEEDLVRAIQSADLLVVEHTTLQAGSLMATLTDTVLAQDRLCASLLARVQGAPRSR